MSKTDFPKVKASLPAPNLPESVGGFISLKDVPKEGMTYEVPEYEGIKEGHVVHGRFGFQGDDVPFEFMHTVARPTSFKILVPREVLLNLTGKKAVAQYWVEEIDGNPASSLVTEVQVTH
ncbi:hypothetical protein [Pseudomonas fluorescens]|uniref:Uncharacterized protein n=1 Tax=Pseudomonas fluorescens TaxID=294 RepID=A0A5E7H0I0_PSEFL|nr:hypothetical protein [Pseudomonas fluorescens]VVO57016.1 hypothetical protein PS880_00599 [Pseudomonas fluorescens]